MTLIEPVIPSDADPPPRSLWRAARLRFRRNVLAVIGLVILGLLIVVCYGGLPYWLGVNEPGRLQRYAQQDLAQVLSAPSAAHWMGTDLLGRDLLGRFLVGGALSLAIGLASAAIAVGIGTVVGLIAGYLGGRTDAILMRLVDVLYGLPYILLVILMRVALVKPASQWLSVPFFKPIVGNPTQWANVLVLLVGIGSVSWLTLARVVRGQVLALRDQPFIEAARAMGVGTRGILLRHLLPNLAGPILVFATLTVPQAVLSESFLSFLGLGIQAPLPSWGNLASEGVEALNPVRVYWWLILWPCAGLSLALLSLNFIGDGLRDALDPKSR